MEKGKTLEALEAELAALQAENARLRTATSASGTPTYKVTLPREPGTNGADDKGSKGGAVSIYGLQRFPFTMYVEQLEAIVKDAKSGKIDQFIRENSAKLLRKDRVKAAVSDKTN